MESWRGGHGMGGGGQPGRPPHVAHGQGDPAGSQLGALPQGALEDRPQRLGKKVDSRKLGRYGRSVQQRR